MLLYITKFLNYVIIEYIFCFHSYTNANQPNLGIASTICTCYCNTIINIINSDSCECQLLFKDVRGIFLYISKAFDSVWHEGLIYKMKCIGITDMPLK